MSRISPTRSLAGKAVACSWTPTISWIRPGRRGDPGRAAGSSRRPVRRSPMAHSMAVVFPAPFGPRMPKISPSATDTENVVHRDQVSVGLTEVADLHRGCVCRHAIRVAGRAGPRQGWNHPHGRGGSSDQAGGEGQPGEVGAAAAAGLVPDPVQVRADRAHGDVELGRDLRVGAALRDQGDQLAFPGAEPGQARRRGRRRSAAAPCGGPLAAGPRRAGGRTRRRWPGSWPRRVPRPPGSRPARAVPWRSAGVPLARPGSWTRAGAARGR